MFMPCLVCSKRIIYRFTKVFSRKQNNAVKPLSLIHICIRNSAFSGEAKEKLLKDFDRMTKMPFGSSENSVLRNYLDTVLELPVGIRTKDVYSCLLYTSRCV